MQMVANGKMAYHDRQNPGLFRPNVAAGFRELVELKPKLQADLLEKAEGRGRERGIGRAVRGGA